MDLFTDSINYNGYYCRFKYIFMFPVALLRTLIIILLMTFVNILSLFMDYNTIGPLFARIVLFTAGFYKTTIKNKHLFNKHYNNKILIYNHSCIFDGFFLISYLYPFSIVIKKSVSLIIKPIIKWCDGIILKNDGNGTRDITDHVNKGKRILMIAPEGGTSNGMGLLPFKTGAFAPLKPIQPVILHYPNKHVNVAWCNGNTLMYFYNMLTQFVNYSSIEVLPLQFPLPDETPESYRDRIRDLMDRRLNIKILNYDRNLI